MIRDNDGRYGVISIEADPVARIESGGLTWDLLEVLDLTWDEFDGAVDSWNELETTDWW